MKGEVCMYQIEQNTRYTIYCNSRWHDIQSGNLRKNGVSDSYEIQFICENLNDTFRYFGNYYSHRSQPLSGFPWKPCKFKLIHEPFSYISCCIIEDNQGKLFYPSMYKNEILRLIDIDDLDYQGEVFYPIRYRKCKIYNQTYVFRKDPVPYTGKLKRWPNDGFYHSVKSYTNALDLDGVNEEMEEKNIDYYIPRQKKQERKKRKICDYKCRHVDHSWKTSSRKKKQWMRCKKGCTVYNRHIYDSTWEEMEGE